MTRLPRSVRIALGALAFVAFIYLLGYPESYCYFYPNIDTRYAPDYSEKNFDSVRGGMTRDEVFALIGKPLYEGDENQDDGTAKLWYSTDGKCGWGDFAWMGRSVILKNGKVSEKEKTIYYD